MKALLVTGIATALMAAGCGGAPAARAHQHLSASAPVKLSRLQACGRLLADVTRNHGIPAIPTLRHIADPFTVPRLAPDARPAVRALVHTAIPPVPLILLRPACAQAGVTIPPPRTPAPPP